MSRHPVLKATEAVHNAVFQLPDCGCRGLFARALASTAHYCGEPPMDEQTESGTQPRRGRRATGRTGPDPVDIHVGKRIRLRRLSLGMKQTELGAALGLSFQQVQKYEHGSNRVSAPALYRLSNTLGVPVSFFFDGLPSSPRTSSFPAEDPLLVRGDGLDLLRRYLSLPMAIRKRVAALLFSLTDGQPGE